MSTRTYLIGQGYDNLRKHGAKTFSTMLIICATMFVLGLFIILFMNVESNVKSVTENQGLQAFIEDTVYERDINGLAEKISAIANVKDIKYLDKEAALEDAKETLKEYGYLLEGMDTTNPFPRSFIITFENLEDTKGVREAIASVDGIYKVSYNEKIIEAVISISNLASYVIIAIGLVMVIISIFIISNTIKLAVYANKREIYIMKYMGATSSFIKYPFVVEGIMLGLASAIISWIVISIGYSAAFIYLPKAGAELGVFGFIGYSNMWHIVLVAFLVLGVFLGGVGSSIATVKYLKEFRPVKVTRKGKHNNSRRNDSTGESEKEKKERLKREKRSEKAERELKKEALKREEKEKQAAEKKSKEEFIRNRKARRLSVFFLALVISTAILPVAVYADVSSTQDKIDALDDQVSEAAKEFETIKKDISIYQKDIAAIEKEMVKYEEEIAGLTGKADIARQEVAEIDTELQKLSTTYEAAEELLNTRLKVLYENGFVNMWEVLFSAENITDFIAKYNVIAILIQNDQKALEEMKDEKAYIQGLKEAAELRRLQIEQVEYDVQKSKEALELAKANKTAKLQSLEASKTRLNKVLANLKAEKAKQEEILRQEILASQNSNLVLSGDFTWPAPGAYYVSAIFKDYEYYREFGIKHYGTDIAKSGGCDIVAAASGKIIKVVYSNSGYGNYVLIDHGKKNGKSYVTLYAHLKSIAVKKGQSVTKGQKIGYMGSTGFSTGTHLHFEIRQNGVQINAMNYYSELGSKVLYLSGGRWIKFPFNNMAKYQHK